VSILCFGGNGGYKFGNFIKQWLKQDKMTKRKRNEQMGKLLTYGDLINLPEILADWFNELTTHAFFCLPHRGKVKYTLDVNIEPIPKTIMRKMKKWIRRFNEEHKGFCYTTEEEVKKAAIHLAWTADA